MKTNFVLLEYLPSIFSKNDEAVPVQKIEEEISKIEDEINITEKQRIANHDLLPKAKTYAAKLPFVRDMVAGYHCMLDHDTPSGVKGAILIPIIYFVVPLDAIPDIIPAAGYTDDLTVWLAAMKAFSGYMKDEHYDKADSSLSNDENLPDDSQHATGRQSNSS